MKNLSIILIILAIFLLIFIYPIVYVSFSDNITITVIKTERIVESSEIGATSKYLVFTNNEVFENTDSWLFLKFDSSDLYGQLNQGQTYKVKVAGWRIPFLNSYRNIIKIN